MTNGKANKLINSTSPYLLQHAYNPVEWYPWGEEALQKARTEDKPILVSIGYSACHWCHVMEHESFEREATAKVMNDHFVCIKIDREERPDLDNIYMEAVQAMGVNGGWPLNVFLMPNLEPFYGGTYFQPQQWTQLLLQIDLAYKEHRPRLVESAKQFTGTLQRNEVDRFNLQPDPDTDFSKENQEGYWTSLSLKFDKVWGGLNRSPKFMMPSIWLWVAEFAEASNNPTVQEQLHLTLTKMARGGLYDQVGGGFSRYSVDAEWFAPHFEKMLYDNGQLLKLYSSAYKLNPDPLYKKVVLETIEWLQTEMLHLEGGYFAALDADSDGEEGKFYTFTWAEWNTILGTDAELAADYYSLEPHGNWESGVNILFPKVSDAAFSERHQLQVVQLEAKIEIWKEKLSATRNKRNKPGLDDKIIISWNALLISGLCAVYRVFQLEEAKTMAERCLAFIAENCMKGELYHTWKNEVADIPAFLDGYALLAQAYYDCYGVTFKQEYLASAKTLTEIAFLLFSDENDPFCFYTKASAQNLIARKKEIFDNVVPASNSALAKVAYLLGERLDRPEWIERSKSMVRSMQKAIRTDIQFTANWAQVELNWVFPTAEVVVIGPNFEQIGNEILPHLPLRSTLIAVANEDGSLSTKGRQPAQGQTLIYVCYDKTCKLPVASVSEALALLS